MSSSYYKHCIVPHCTSSTIKTPDKLFIYVPNNKKRIMWLKLAGRNDSHRLSPYSRMYFCEDHFDLPKDMANYMQYHLMGKVSVIRMHPESVPTKFDCQQDRLRESETEESFEECEKVESLESHQITTESIVLMKEDVEWNSASDQLCAEYVVQVELVEDEECLQPPDVIFANDSSNRAREPATPSRTPNERPSRHGGRRNSKPHQLKQSSYLCTNLKTG